VFITLFTYNPIQSMSTTSTPEIRPPVPPFSLEDAIKKVRLAENAWNTRDPHKVTRQPPSTCLSIPSSSHANYFQVKMAYTVDSEWRNRSTFLKGRDEIAQFLNLKWDRELEYRLIKEIWCHSNNRIAVRFAYEYHNENGDWFRAYGKSLSPVYFMFSCLMIYAIY
jgi:nuclear transport factor 2 (NTF2) superfamily protein